MEINLQERNIGFKPMTSTLARLRSITELIPHKDAEEPASPSGRYCPLFVASQKRSYTFLLHPVGFERQSISPLRLEHFSSLVAILRASECGWNRTSDGRVRNFTDSPNIPTVGTHSQQSIFNDRTETVYETPGARTQNFYLKRVLRFQLRQCLNNIGFYSVVKVLSLVINVLTSGLRKLLGLSLML